MFPNINGLANPISSTGTNGSGTAIHATHYAYRHCRYNNLK